MIVLSWNLLHRGGADLDEVARMIQRHRPDLLLMQEVTEAFTGLVPLVGGLFAREPLPDRRHGLAMWLPSPSARPPASFALPDGAFVRRICQTVDLGRFTVANVHLSHGQVLNRRQLRFIAHRVPHTAAIVGDFNMLGPAMIPGFHDAGPRRRTHRMSNLLPLRLDRCLLRGLVCTRSEVLPQGGSDHHPILLQLEHED
jgi:endonuclease/exonuclease/phosphatase family metal-dependent hydrolase